MEDYSNEIEEYYSTLKDKYSPNDKKKPNKLKHIINVFTYQLIIVLVLTLGSYILKISDAKKSDEILSFVKENIYFKGILPPHIEKFEIVQKTYNMIKEGYDKIKVNSF